MLVVLRGTDGDDGYPAGQPRCGWGQSKHIAAENSLAFALVANELIDEIFSSIWQHV
jgi:hypothetical protein